MITVEVPGFLGTPDSLVLGYKVPFGFCGGKSLQGCPMQETLRLADLRPNSEHQRLCEETHFRGCGTTALHEHVF